MFQVWKKEDVGKVLATIYTVYLIRVKNGKRLYCLSNDDKHDVWFWDDADQYVLIDH